MVRYAITLVFFSIIVFFISLAIRLGAFKDVHIEQNQRAAVALLYKAHIGAYHKINPIIQEVEAWALKENLPCTRTFGEYIDDPQTSDEARLRSHGGCVLDGITSLSRSGPLPEGFAIKTLPAGEYIIAQFSGSPAIGPFKVYPKVEDYLRKQGLKVSGPVFEIYTVTGDREARTEYLFPFSPAVPLSTAQ